MRSKALSLQTSARTGRRPLRPLLALAHALLLWRSPTVNRLSLSESWLRSLRRTLRATAV